MEDKIEMGTTGQEIPYTEGRKKERTWEETEEEDKDRWRGLVVR